MFFVTTQVAGFGVQGSENPVGLAPKFSLSCRMDDWGRRRSGLGNCFFPEPRTLNSLYLSSNCFSMVTTQVSGFRVQAINEGRRHDSRHPLSCLPAEGSAQAGTNGAGGDQASATAFFLNPEP